MKFFLTTFCFVSLLVFYSCSKKSTCPAANKTSKQNLNENETPFGFSPKKNNNSPDKDTFLSRIKRRKNNSSDKDSFMGRSKNKKATSVDDSFLSSSKKNTYKPDKDPFAVKIKGRKNKPSDDPFASKVTDDKTLGEKGLAGRKNFGKRKFWNIHLFKKRTKEEKQMDTENQRLFTKGANKKEKKERERKNKNPEMGLFPKGMNRYQK